jgi:hypothetical protein
MSQKKVRLLQDINTNTASIKALKINIVILHSDMARLNDLVGRNSRMHEELKNENFVVEQEFIQELKDMEKEAVDMEAKIASTKASKNQILDEIVEAERQIMLWEKKIQVRREREKEIAQQRTPSVSCAGGATGGAGESANKRCL